jgi:DNA-binding protein H-NS
MATNINVNTMNKAQLETLAQRVGKRLKEVNGSELQAARKAVQKIAKDSGFSMDDLIGSSPSTNATATANTTGRTPKYRNPKDHSQTWGGRGKHPGWLANAIKGGAKLEQFAIH